MRSSPISVVLALGIFLSGPVFAEKATFILFRHAEKTTGSHDPGLSEAGKKRAVAIGAYLQKMGVTRILSTDYRRTRETVEPISKATGIKIEIYDPGNLDDLAEELKKMSGIIAISGHSNTTPELAALLSGNTTEPMPETEYDWLYTIFSSKEGDFILSVSQQE